MKKTFQFFYAIAVVSLITCSFGCKKEGSGGTSSASYFVKFKVNGVQKEFTITTGLFTQYNLGGGYPAIYTASFEGVSSASTPTVNNMLLSVSDIAAIATNKTFKSVTVSTTIAASLVYMDAAGLIHGSDYITTGAVDDDAVIKLTEITATSISGTFSGRVVSLGSNTPLTITEGSFRVKKM